MQYWPYHNDIANSAPLCSGKLEKLPPTGHIMRPRAAYCRPRASSCALRPSGGNMRPLGDIMFGPRAANFPVSLAQGCRIVTMFHVSGLYVTVF